MYLSAFLTLALDGDSHTITVCLVTIPYPLPMPVLHTVWSSAPSFNFQYLIIFLRSYSSCLHHLPHILITSIFGWILVLLYTQKNTTSIYWTRHMIVSSVGVDVIQGNAPWFHSLSDHNKSLNWPSYPDSKICDIYSCKYSLCFKRG